MVNEADQQILTSAIIREAKVSLRELWVHYLSIGGRHMPRVIADYINGCRALPTRERDLLAWAYNDLVLDSPSLPRAPYSHSPLVVEPRILDE